MKKLIAKSPVLNSGRLYRAGDALPTQNEKLVAAWLRAGTAEWTGGAEVAPPTESTAPLAERVLCALAMFGVTAVDDAGEYIGDAALYEQFFSIFAKSGALDESDQLTANEKTGHLDAADLERWKKADLEKLADDLGVAISTCKNNKERAAAIAAVEVKYPKDGADAQ